MPASFGSTADQYHAAVEKCVVVDPLLRDQLELRGKDRSSFLHNFCTQEIKKLSPGRGAEAFVTNIKGRILGHVLVFVGESAIGIDTVAGSAAGLAAHLDRYLISEDVQIRDVSGEWGEIALVGPQAGTLIEKLYPGSGSLQPFQHGDWAGVSLRRFSFSRQPGWLLGAARAELPAIRDRLLAAGAVLCGCDVFNALRIEAGFPVYGVDLTHEHLAQEAGRTKQAVCFTKGCYLGQEPIARIDALGHTNRELRGLRLRAPVGPPVGSRVIHAESSAEIGTISSSAVSPISKVGVALGMLRREQSPPGTELQVVVDGTSLSATVIEL